MSNRFEFSKVIKTLIDLWSVETKKYIISYPNFNLPYMKSQNFGVEKKERTQNLGLELGNIHLKWHSYTERGRER